MIRILFMSVFCFTLAYSQTVNNVRLIQPIPYMINVITETVQRLEDAEWCNLRVSDVTVDMNEVVFGTNIKGTVTYKNGFVVSIRQVDILQHTLGQVWRYNRDLNTTTVDVTGTLRFSDITIGFDVEATIEGTVRRYTAELLVPLASFAMSVVRDMFSEVIDVTVTPAGVTRNRVKMDFMPKDELTDILSNLFNFNAVTDSVNVWASDFLRPFALNAVENVIEFPEICYDCPVS